MKRYAINRILQLIPVLLCITFVTFAMMRLTADDAVDIMYEQSGGAVEDVKAVKRAELGLDKPFLVQYANWLKNIATGDMGKSYISNKLVFETFIEKLPATFELMFVSMLMTLLIAVPLGIISAVKQNHFIDYAIRFSTFFGNSMPNFFAGLLLIYFFALKLHLLPIIGQDDSLIGVILPALTLTISMSAKYIRQIRAIVLEELNKPYIIGARALGFSETSILIKFVLPSSMIVVVTLIALSIGSLLGGTAIVETIFMWDGVGKLAVDAVLMRDYPIIQAYVVWLSTIYVFINLIADLIYSYINPRIDYAK